MAFEFVNMEGIPRGRRASEPAVTITENGRLAFTSAASKVFADTDTLFRFGYDAATRRVMIQAAATMAKGVPESAYVRISRPKDSKSGITASFVPFLAALRTKGYEYNCAELGNQSYEAMIYTEKGNRAVIFALPAPDAMPARKPKRPRAPNKAKTAKVVAVPEVSVEVDDIEVAA